MHAFEDAGLPVSEELRFEVVLAAKVRLAGAARQEFENDVPAYDARLSPICPTNSTIGLGGKLGDGHYYWSWIVNQDGSISDDNIIQLVAGKNLHLTMDAAVAAWNTQAPSLSHNTFPAFNKLMY